jgi:hypothetical protein
VSEEDEDAAKLEAAMGRVTKRSFVSAVIVSQLNHLLFSLKGKPNIFRISLLP